MPTITSRVIQSEDDAYERTGTVGLTSNFVVAGAPGTAAYHMGLRFTDNIAGLAGVTIDDAYLTFRAAYGDTGNFQGNWYAQLAEAPGQFTTGANDITDRTRTTTACRGDGVADFGDWTAGEDEIFRGTGPFQLKALIQELLDAPNSFDPSAIVLMHIYTSGLGERIGRSYDFVTATAPLLTIDYTAATGDQTLLAPATAASLDLVTATLTGAGAATLTAPSVAVGLYVPTATLSAEGAATLTAPATVVNFVAATPTLTISGAVPLVAPQTQVTLVVPSAVLSLVGAEILIAPATPTSLVVATHTLSGSSAVTLTAPANAASLVVATHTLVPDTATLVSPELSVTFNIVSPVLIPRIVVLTAPANAVNFVVPEATLVGGGSLLTFEPWGDITQLIDPGELASGASFILQVNIFTSSAANTVTARLFDVAAGTEVSGTDSRVTSTSTTVEVVRSSTFNLPSGLREYRLEFGGPSGSVVYCHGGEVKGVSS